ncbi:MAG: phenylalanine--tRNA ligase subunit beta [Gammaproteobacteria bacterium]
MKFSEQWLRTWVTPKLNTEQLAAQLTMAGLEVESIAPVIPDFNKVVVGEVIAAQQHPDAERLTVCQVTVGSEQPLTIVCGASNVRVGLKAPVALVGAILPGDLKIKKARLRGVESQGMLCSASELGFMDAVKGLMELPDDAPIGMDFRDYLQLNDSILDINITPNRGDCLSVAGLAREVAALNDCQLNAQLIKPVVPTIPDTFPVKVLAHNACPRYVGRVIRGIDSNVRTPLWMQERLRRSGLRSIHPVVDITNYVMLELGQPLHAFDLQQLSDEIQVRMAQPHEKIILLDGQEVILTENTLVIADAKQPQAIAGIMGGAASGVSGLTRDVFLESAFFAPILIASTLRHSPMQSDAAYRFERGVDYQLPVTAMERATALLLEICGGQAGPLIETAHTPALPKQVIIHLRRQRIPRVLGITLTDEEVVAILSRLGMEVQPYEDGWQVKVPSYRFDLTLEVDLLEELARFYGYDRIVAKKPQAPLRIVVPSEKRLSSSRFREALIDKGYQEVIAYSFVAPALQTLLTGQQPSLKLNNPISSDMAVMRTHLWPGLLQAALYNQRRQQARVRIFEIGLCFTQQEGQLQQRMKLGGLAMGSAYPEQWGMPLRIVDFFDIKGDLEALLGLTKQGQEWQFHPGSHPALHPNQTAAIKLRDQTIGYVGALHPSHEQTLELQGPVFLFELDLEALQQGQLPQYRALSKFPAIRRDLALVVAQEVAIQPIYQEIMRLSDDLLQQVQLFDIYQGKSIEVGKKSLALSLTFQHASRTLIEEEVNVLLQKIIAGLQQTFGAKLRE